MDEADEEPQQAGVQHLRHSRLESRDQSVRMNAVTELIFPNMAGSLFDGVRGGMQSRSSCLRET